MNSRKEKQVNIRLSKDVYEEAMKKAKQAGESLSEYVRRIIHNALKK